MKQNLMKYIKKFLESNSDNLEGVNEEISSDFMNRTRTIFSEEAREYDEILDMLLDYEDEGMVFQIVFYISFITKRKNRFLNLLNQKEKITKSFSAYSKIDLINSIDKLISIMPRHVRAGIDFTRSLDDWEINPRNLNLSVEISSSISSFTVWKNFKTSFMKRIESHFPHLNVFDKGSALYNRVSIEWK